MNNRFESKSEAHAKQYLTEMFEAGCEWADGSRGYHPLYHNYYFCCNCRITHGDLTHSWDKYYDLPTYELKNPPEAMEVNPNQTEQESDWSTTLWVQPFLTPDFSELKVGDPVKCVMRGDGIVETIKLKQIYPIEVRFNSGSSETYTIDGRAFEDKANPTLFYHFPGQFPTAEACVRPKPDAYELHGVTREEIKKYAEAVVNLTGGVVQNFIWHSNGHAYANVIINKVVSLVPISHLNRPSPYEHWETPIMLGGES